GILTKAEVGEFRIPVPASLRREIEKVVDRRQQVDSAFLHILAQPRVRGVRMAQRAVRILCEHRNRRVLPAFRIFTSKVVLERTVGTAEEPKVAPAAG